MISYKIIFITAAIGTLPAFGWLWFIIKKNHLDKEGVDRVLKVFFWGIISAVPTCVIEFLLLQESGGSELATTMQNVWQHQKTSMVADSFFVSVFFVAAIEEFFKGMVIFYWSIHDRIVTVKKGMMYGMIAGLAFGVTENGVYFASAHQAQTENLVAIIFLRFILSTSAHIIYSGLAGALLAETLAKKGTMEKIVGSFFVLAIPISIHMCFNVLVTTTHSYLSLLIVAGGFFLLWMKYWLGGNDSCKKEIWEKNISKN